MRVDPLPLMSASKLRLPMSYSALVHRSDSEDRVTAAGVTAATRGEVSSIQKNKEFRQVLIQHRVKPEIS